MEFRTERDSLGEVQIPADKLWGPQTQRSLQNFEIGREKMPKEIITAFAYLKKAAAKANEGFDKLDSAKTQAIMQACDEVLAGKWDAEFPLAVWQTGSGTQSNMNMNEVLAHRGNQISPDAGIHPNDHVNMGQSSNDTFPTAMHVAAVLMLEQKLLPSLGLLAQETGRLAEENKDIVKIGRTHLQDAVPLTLGQEMSGWHTMLTEAYAMIEASLPFLRQLAISGTAVGTGLNTHPMFGENCANLLSEYTNCRFSSAPNKFHALTSRDAFVFSHGALKALAGNLMKMANDVRWLASGPRCGIGEISIPENEPGSSIMPGKVNPTQCEAITMVAVQVMGNDAGIGFASSQGNFELNVFLPVIANSFLQSALLLADGMDSFRTNCVQGIRPNLDRIAYNLENSLMLVTALNPVIGYEKSAKIAQQAFKDGTTLKQAAVKLGYLSEEDFDKHLRPENMLAPRE